MRPVWSRSRSTRSTCSRTVPEYQARHPRPARPGPRDERVVDQGAIRAAKVGHYPGAPLRLRRACWAETAVSPSATSASSRAAERRTRRDLDDLRRAQTSSHLARRRCSRSPSVAAPAVVWRSRCGSAARPAPGAAPRTKTGTAGRRPARAAPESAGQPRPRSPAFTVVRLELVVAQPQSRRRSGRGPDACTRCWSTHVPLVLSRSYTSQVDSTQRNWAWYRETCELASTRRCQAAARRTSLEARLEREPQPESRRRAATPAGAPGAPGRARPRARSASRKRRVPSTPRLQVALVGRERPTKRAARLHAAAARLRVLDQLDGDVADRPQAAFAGIVDQVSTELVSQRLAVVGEALRSLGASRSSYTLGTSLLAG